MERTDEAPDSKLEPATGRVSCVVFVTIHGHTLIREPDDQPSIKIELSVQLPMTNGRIQWPNQNLLGATQRSLEAICSRLLATLGFTGTQ